MGKTKERTKNVRSFSLDDGVFAALDKQADENDRSNSGELNAILRKYFFGGR